MELERLLLSMKKREDIISQEVMEEKKRSEDLESRNDREVAKRLRSEKMVEDERERREELEGVLQQERKRMSHIMMSSPTQDNEGGENDLMIANINRKYQEESPSSSNYQFHYPIQPTNSSTSPPSQQHQHRSPIQHHHQDEITPQRYSPSPSSSSGSNNSQPSPSTYDEFSPSSQDI